MFIGTNPRVNLSHVISFEVVQQVDDKLATVFRLVDGSKVTLKGDRSEQIENLGTQAIPAYPGFEVIAFCWEAHQDEDPATFEIAYADIEHVPVIGWRLGVGDQPEPILPSGDRGNFGQGWFTAVRWPNGTVDVPYDRVCKSIDEWIEYVRETWTEIRASVSAGEGSE